MFVLPGILGLVVFTIARPFELIESLRGLPFLHFFCALGILGYLLDLRVGYCTLRLSKLVAWALAWLAWVVLTALVNPSSSLSKTLVELGILFVTFFLIANGVQTVSAFEKVAATVLACSLWICSVCVHQGLQPSQCVISNSEAAESLYGTPTGVPCTSKAECNGARCEKVGLFGVTSVGQRVRYTGILQDPNEVAMLVSSTLPFAYAFQRRRRSWFRNSLAALMTLLVIVTVIQSQSRGGLLVLIAVAVAYGVQRLGMQRFLLAAPLLALAFALLTRGPERADAEESKMKRLGCMLTGVELVREHPLVGVGFRQFTQYHDQTAHNAYVLVGAETGFPGLVLWSVVAYVALKTALSGRRSSTKQRGAVVHIWSTALATALAGLFVGIFFLSFAYHAVLWILFGLAGAWGGIQQRHGTGRELGARPGELIALTIVCFSVLLAIYIYASAELEGFDLNHLALTATCAIERDSSCNGLDTPLALVR